MRLKGKKAVVTGGASGMGEATSIHFAQEGAEVAILDVNIEGARTTAEKIREVGGAAHACKVDLRNVEEIAPAIEAAAGSMQGINVLANIAGVFEQGSIQETDEAVWDFNVDINLKGSFFTIQAVLPYMLKEGKGKIINFSSIAGEVAFERSIAYCASKAGVIGMTKAMAMELAPKKINVNCIGPGNISTPMNAHLLKDPAYVRRMEAATPYGRVGQVSDITPAVVFLASDESNYINGATLYVDGGWIVV